MDGLDGVHSAVSLAENVLVIVDLVLEVLFYRVGMDLRDARRIF